MLCILASSRSLTGYEVEVRFPKSSGLGMERPEYFGYIENPNG